MFTWTCYIKSICYMDFTCSSQIICTHLGNIIDFHTWKEINFFFPQNVTNEGHPCGDVNAHDGLLPAARLGRRSFPYHTSSKRDIK